MKKIPAVLKLRPWEKIEATQVLLCSKHSQLIEDFIVQNASRAERFQSKAFQSLPTDTESEIRLLRWKNELNLQNGWTFEEINTIRGFSPDILTLSLQNVTLKDNTLLPKWAILATELAEEVLSGSIEVHNLFEPFQNLLLKRIHTCFQSQKVLKVEDKAYLSLLNSILARWAELFAGLPELKINSATLRAALLELFKAYPFLIRRMAEIVISILDHVEILFANLVSDKKDLCKVFRINSDAVFDLADLSVGNGDSHNCGATVTRLSFKNGWMLIYKPKNLKITQWFAEFSKMLFAGMNEELYLKYPVRLIRDNYAWEEFITEKECKDIDEIKLFYKRAGVLIQLAQAARCQDLHGENIIASGSYPVPIDLEAIGSPLPKIIKKNYQWLEPLLSCYFQSPLCLGILPTLEETANGELFYDTTFPSKHKNAIRSTISLPQFKGKAASIEDFVEELTEGYTAARKAVEKNIEKADRKLFDFSTHLIRFIPRNTALYATILKDSMVKHPKTFVEAELNLEVILYSSIIDKRYLIEIIDQEIWSLSHGDIPFFSSQPGKKTIFASGQRRITVGFMPVNLNTFISKLIRTNPLQSDLDLIRTAISVLNFPI